MASFSICRRAKCLCWRAKCVNELRLPPVGYEVAWQRRRQLVEHLLAPVFETNSQPAEATVAAA